MNLAGMYRNGSHPQGIIPGFPWVPAICLIQTERRTAVMEEHIHFLQALIHYH